MRTSARIGFEVRTRNEAFDLEPVLARYRSARVASVTAAADLAVVRDVLEHHLGDLDGFVAAVRRRL